MRTPNEVTILIIDDDMIDVESIKRAIKKLRISNPVIVACDGIEALQVLRGQNGHERLEEPYLIILDINMPRMNGLEFLSVLRDDRELNRAVIFVHTTSDNSRDQSAAYDKNIAGYILKTDLAGSLDDALRMLERYWRIIEFPD